MSLALLRKRLKYYDNNYEFGHKKILIKHVKIIDQIEVKMFMLTTVELQLLVLHFFKSPQL